MRTGTGTPGQEWTCKLSTSTSHGRGLWREGALVVPWLLCQQRHLYLPGFCTTFAHCGVWSGSSLFVLFSSRVGVRRTAVWPSCSQTKVRALSCWHQGICGNSAYCTQRGRRTSRETKRELWRVHSLFVCFWFITSVKSFVHCRCLICPCSRHYSFVENNTCIDLNTASPPENQCSVILQVSSVRVSPLT